MLDILKGKFLFKVIGASLGFLLFSTNFITPAQASVNRIIDVVSVQYTGSEALDPSIMRDVRSALESEVIPFWRSKGGIDFQVGIIESQPMVSSQEIPCEGNALVKFMTNLGNEFYKAKKIDGSSRYLVIELPVGRTACPWTGMGLMGQIDKPYGVVAVINSNNPGVIMHELGHNLGLGHTNLMDCPSGGDYSWELCSFIPYGGIVDIMGSSGSRGSLNPMAERILKFLPVDNIYSITKSDTVILRNNKAIDGIKAIYLRDGTAEYFFELRDDEVNSSIGLTGYRIDQPTVDKNNTYASSSALTKSGNDTYLMNLNNYNAQDGTGTWSSLNFSSFTENVKITATPVKDVDNFDALSLKIEVKNDSHLTSIPLNSEELDSLNPLNDLIANKFNYSLKSRSLSTPTQTPCNNVLAIDKDRVARSQGASTIKLGSWNGNVATDVIEFKTIGSAIKFLEELDKKSCTLKLAKKTFGVDRPQSRIFLYSQKGKNTVNYHYLSYQLINNFVYVNDITSNVLPTSSLYSSINKLILFNK